jgi:hypothetical protein
MSAVQQIASGRLFFYAIDDDGPLGRKNSLVGIGVELAGGKAAPRGEATERIREPVGQVAEIVQGDEPPIGGRNHQIALISPAEI